MSANRVVSSLADELIEKGFEKGFEKGRREALVNAILTVITARFREVPSDLTNALTKIDDSARLERLLTIAAIADSTAEIQRRLAE